MFCKRQLYEETRTGEMLSVPCLLKVRQASSKIRQMHGAGPNGAPLCPSAADTHCRALSGSGAVGRLAASPVCHMPATPGYGLGMGKQSWIEHVPCIHGAPSQGAGDDVVILAGLDAGQTPAASLGCLKSRGLSSGWGEPRLQSQESGSWEALAQAGLDILGFGAGMAPRGLAVGLQGSGAGRGGKEEWRLEGG